MPECANCGHHVTEDYQRVFSRDGGPVECCPWCDDIVRRDGQLTEARSTRRE